MPKKDNTFPETELTYLCNAGFLLCIGDLKIVLDGLSKDENGLYQDTPPEQKRMLQKLASEGAISLMIITHDHSDHYCREDVCDVIRASEQAGKAFPVLAAQAAAADLEEGCGPERTAVRNGIRSFPPEEKGSPLVFETEEAETGTSARIRIYAGNAVHDGKQYASVQNMIILTEIGTDTETLRIVFTGDASPTRELFARIAAWSGEIDWLIAPFPYVGKPSVRRLLERSLNVRHIAACHLPREEKDLQGWITGAEMVCREAKDSLPAPVFLKNPGTKLDLLQPSEKYPGF